MRHLTFTPSTENTKGCSTFKLRQSSGALPPRARGLVAEWGSQHEAELFELWEDAQAGRALRTLDPLP